MLAACSSSDSKSVTGPPTGPASLIIALNSLTQTGTIGQLAGTRPSIRVMDSSRVGVSGVAVTFTVVSGGGSVTGGTQ
ncbi:MAG TPA: hypothetical protein VEI47_00495, partial [Gemmatimonadales bacterium]|nr:hypothetical protein [Gemmatimonadales bacterium]